MTLPNTLSVEAPAKINLFLRVLGRRGDGYHDIESLMVPISLADRLEIHAHADPSEFRTLSLSLEVRGDPEVVRGVPVDESNLVLEAASALAREAGVRGFAEFDLDKRIPTSAGLGGGSADAAAALTALDRLWGCELGLEALSRVGSEVGADVPALLRGGPVLVSGRGERVEPRPPVELDLVLVPFDFGISTADAYQWWDEDGGRTGPSDESVFNDLEEPVMRRHPRIREARDGLLAAGATAAVMCGSGPTVAGILDPDGLEDEAEAALERISGRPVVYARARNG